MLRREEVKIMLRLFIRLEIAGMVLISIMAFTIPSNPFEIIPAIGIEGFDKPLWLNIIIGFGFIYSVVLLIIYDRINRKSNTHND